MSNTGPFKDPDPFAWTATQKQPPTVSSLGQEPLRECLEWIASQTDLFFAECSQAEEIIARVKAALTSASPSVASGELLQRVQNYLGNGGFFNPESMAHDKVRELIMDLACGHGWHFGATCAPSNSGESVIAGTDLEGRAGKPPLGARSLSATSEHIDSPESLGLSIDMLDVDRLREWARLLLIHGADIGHWGSVPFVASKMQTMATELEKAIRDIGVLRGASASPQAKGEDWQLIDTVQADAEFIIGAWSNGPDLEEVGELSRDGDYWDDIVGERRTPHHWMPLPLPPSALPASLDEPQQP